MISKSEIRIWISLKLYPSVIIDRVLHDAISLLGRVTISHCWFVSGDVYCITFDVNRDVRHVYRRLSRIVLFCLFICFLFASRLIMFIFIAYNQHESIGIIAKSPPILINEQSSSALELLLHQKYPPTSLSVPWRVVRSLC